MSSLCDLPDEILLEVVRYFAAIRSYETQSVAFRNKQIEKERQRENNLRQRTLYALCLTCRRLRFVSLPTLYGSSITSATQDGLRRLGRLYRTISSQQQALGQSKRLSEYILYVENRLADHRGNSLSDDEYFQEHLAVNYFQLLALIFLNASNIENLCTVSLEHDDVSFWIPVLDKSSHPALNGPPKLRHVSVQIHAQTVTRKREISTFWRLCVNLHLFTALSDLRISGASTNRLYQRAIKIGQLPRVRRLELTECGLDIYEVAQLLQACSNVQAFTCRWTFLDNANSGPSELRSALLAHADTLQELTLDFREIRYSPNVDLAWHMLRSLRPMEVLQYLEICERGFLDSDLSLLDSPDQTMGCDLSKMFPESIRHIRLLANGIFSHYSDDVLEEALGLLELASKCKTSVPHLKTLCIVVQQEQIASNIEMAFDEVGVRFYTELEN